MDGWLILAFNAQSRAMTDAGFKHVQPWLIRVHWRIWRRGNPVTDVKNSRVYKMNCEAFRQFPELFGPCAD